MGSVVLLDDASTQQDFLWLLAHKHNLLGTGALDRDERTLFTTSTAGSPRDGASSALSVTEGSTHTHTHTGLENPTAVTTLLSCEDGSIDFTRGLLADPEDLLSGLQNFRFLKAGAFGAVYSANWHSTRVAVKFISSTTLSNDAPCVREALLSRELDHVNIVKALSSRIAFFDKDTLARLAINACRRRSSVDAPGLPYYLYGNQAAGGGNQAITGSSTPATGILAHVYGGPDAGKADGCGGCIQAGQQDGSPGAAGGGNGMPNIYGSQGNPNSGMNSSAVRHGSASSGGRALASQSQRMLLRSALHGSAAMRRNSFKQQQSFRGGDANNNNNGIYSGDGRSSTGNSNSAATPTTGTSCHDGTAPGLSEEASDDQPDRSPHRARWNLNLTLNTNNGASECTAGTGTTLTDMGSSTSRMSSCLAGTEQQLPSPGRTRDRGVGGELSVGVYGSGPPGAGVGGMHELAGLKTTPPLDRAHAHCPLRSMFTRESSQAMSPMMHSPHLSEPDQLGVFPAGLRQDMALGAAAAAAAASSLMARARAPASTGEYTISFSNMQLTLPAADVSSSDASRLPLGVAASPPAASVASNGNNTDDDSSSDYTRRTAAATTLTATTDANSSMCANSSSGALPAVSMIVKTSRIGTFAAMAAGTHGAGSGNGSVMDNNNGGMGAMRGVIGISALPHCPNSGNGVHLPITGGSVTPIAVHAHQHVHGMGNGSLTLSPTPTNEALDRSGSCVVTMPTSDVVTLSCPLVHTLPQMDTHSTQLSTITPSELGLGLDLSYANQSNNGDGGGIAGLFVGVYSGGSACQGATHLGSGLLSTSRSTGTSISTYMNTAEHVMHHPHHQALAVALAASAAISGPANATSGMPAPAMMCSSNSPTEISASALPVAGGPVQPDYHSDSTRAGRQSSCTLRPVEPPSSGSEISSERQTPVDNPIFQRRSLGLPKVVEQLNDEADQQEMVQQVVQLDADLRDAVTASFTMARPACTQHHHQQQQQPQEPEARYGAAASSYPPICAVPALVSHYASSPSAATGAAGCVASSAPHASHAIGIGSGGSLSSGCVGGATPPGPGMHPLRRRLHSSHSMPPKRVVDPDVCVCPELQEAQIAAPGSACRSSDSAIVCSNAMGRSVQSGGLECIEETNERNRRSGPGGWGDGIGSGSGLVGEGEVGPGAGAGSSPPRALPAMLLHAPVVPPSPRQGLLRLQLTQSTLSVRSSPQQGSQHPSSRVYRHVGSTSASTDVDANCYGTHTSNASSSVAAIVASTSTAAAGGVSASVSAVGAQGDGAEGLLATPTRASATFSQLPAGSPRSLSKAPSFETHHNVRMSRNTHTRASAHVGLWDILLGMAPNQYVGAIVMEYCNLGSLDGLCKKDPFNPHHATTGKTALRALLSLALQVARGMAYLHGKGLVHGDLKPANVLLHRVNDKKQVLAKVADFGMLKQHTAEPPRKQLNHSAYPALDTCASDRGHAADRGGVVSGSIDVRTAAPEAAAAVSPSARFSLDAAQPPAAKAPRGSDHGTIVYSAPEHLVNGFATFASDVWSYGLVLYCMASGKRPFEEVEVEGHVLFGISYQHWKPEWPADRHPELRALYEACVDDDPDKRPAFSTIVSNLEAMSMTASGGRRCSSISMSQQLPVALPSSPPLSPPMRQTIPVNIAQPPLHLRQGSQPHSQALPQASSPLQHQANSSNSLSLSTSAVGPGPA